MTITTERRALTITTIVHAVATTITATAGAPTIVDAMAGIERARDAF